MTRPIQLTVLLALLTIQTEAQVFLPHRHSLSVVSLPWTSCTCSPQTAPDNTLLARWAFTEGSGYYTDDLSGNGNRLLMNNGASWVSFDGGGYGIELNGLGGFLRTTSPITLSSNIVTVTALIKWNLTGTNEVVWCSSPDPYVYGRGNFEAAFVHSSFQNAVNILNGSGGNHGIRQNFAAPATNQWLGFACVYDNSTTNGETKAYQCTNQQAQVIINNDKDYTGNLCTTNFFFIGDYGTTAFNGGNHYPLKSILKDIRIYGGELSQDEICYVFNHYADTGTPSAVSTLTSNLVAFWPMEELSGTRYDHWGTNHLTASNTVGIARMLVQNGAAFTWTTTNSLNGADSPELSAGSTNFMAACWVQLSDKTTHPSAIFGKRTESTWEYQLRYSTVDTRFDFDILDSGSTLHTVKADALGVPSINTPYFIVTWMDTSADKMYIQVNNGNTNSLALAGARPSDTTATFHVGINGLTPYAASYATVDELAIWRRVLTEAERTTLYNSGQGRSIP